MFIRLIMILISLTSCAKLSYVVEQAQGQFSLLYKGKKNEKVLADHNIDEKVKDKIRLVQKAKSYFYDFFDRRETAIYNKTTLLDRKAVTYLVIASPKDKVEPLRHRFPFVGSFPYLGFFSNKSAEKFEAKLKNKGYSTYLRNVYAYSTLGNFNDRILSSFFNYTDEGLTELVFHELIHTIFFIKNEVSFNENMANFFAEKMLENYLERKIIREDDTQIRKKIVEEIQRLNSLYANEKTNHEAVFQKFMVSFRTNLQDVCKSEKLSNCWPLRIDDWSNARLAAFMTYNEGQKIFNELYERNGKDLNQFILFLESKYSEFRKNKRKLKLKSFYSFLEEME